MTRQTNPQAEQMGDESMVRNLAWQAQAIWPQEQALFDRYDLPGDAVILDLGCGTGEITRRLSARFAHAVVIGVDVLDSNLALARSAAATDADPRIRYEQGDAFALAHADAHFDLVVCRHLSQAVPDFALVLAEIGRVLKPGGWVHLLSEDYGMLHMPAIDFDPDRFWNENAIAYLRSIGCDGRIGRHSPALLEAAGYTDLAVDYVIVDTVRVPRRVFAGIIGAWRDGYLDVLAAASSRTTDEVSADFDRIIDAIETPPNYAVWHVPVISARKPTST